MKLLHLINFLLIASPMLGGNAYRILAVFSYNGKSHFMVYEQLAKGLAARGHQVDVVSHHPLKKAFQNYNQVVNLAGTMSNMRNNLTYDFIKEIADFSPVRYAATKLGVDICELLGHPDMQKLIKNPPEDPPYDLLIADIFGATCYLALGQHLNVPVVGTVPGVMWPWANGMVANPEDPAYIPGVLSGLVEPMNFWDRVTNVFTLAKDKWEFNYYTDCQDEQIKKYIGPHAPGVREAERNVSLILTNSHYSLNGVRPYTTAVVEIGGIHISRNVNPLPKDLQEWLDNGEEGFVYLSFGSMLKFESFPREKILAMFASIKKLSPIRVLMKIAKPGELPPGLPGNVLVLPWINQLAVLKHKRIRAFVTHGGLMGTQEAVHCGVPMIGIPVFSDQHQNMNLYVRKRVAVVVKETEITEKNMDAAFDAVLNDPSYKETAKKLSSEFRDRPMSAMDTAVFWIEYVIRHGGVNLRSPAMDLTWWQLALYDVYGVLLTAVLIALWLLVFLVSKMIAAIPKNDDDRSLNSKKVK